MSDTPVPSSGPHAVPPSLAVGDVIRVRYTNWRHETAVRNIRIDGAPFRGATEWHPEDCWLVSGFDLDKGAARIWSVSDMEMLP